ncbi:MAG: hypothetical protein EXQ89_05460 [Rhodospirillaceae bacterium]|nr:hypothetical protein [Rhodospirillaceae bacterium]
MLAHRTGFTLAAGLAVLVAGTAAAQSPKPTTAADPRALAPFGYRSVFRDFRKFGPTETVPWKDANEAVAKVGGHVGVLAAPETPSDGRTGN